MSTVICPNCKTPASPGAIFCDECGYDLRNVPVETSATPPVSASPQPTGGNISCTKCSYSNLPGSSFCENCGAQLDQGSISAATPSSVPSVDSSQPQITPSGFISGRLVIQSSNTNIPFPTGKSEIIIGREDAVSDIFPEIDLESYGGTEAGVGRQHAKLFSKGGQILLDDLQSVNGTFLNKQRVLPGQPKPVNNGDELRFGKVVAIFYSS